MMNDLRATAHSLGRAPAFTLTVILTVALGVGAVTAVFSVVSGVLLRPLPYADGHELMRVHASWEGNPVASLSPGEHFDFHRRLTAFEAFGTYTYGSFTLAGDEGPRRVQAGFVTAGVLDALEVEPILGRTFGPGEDGPDGNLVLVSRGFWQRELGGDPEVLGRTLPVGGSSVEVVGVLPSGFLLPEGVVSGDPVDIVAPLGLDPATVQSHGSHFLLGVGRRRAGVSYDEAEADVARVGEWIVENFGEDYGGPMTFGAMPLAEDLVGDSRSALLMLLTAAGFVLLIACANTANLLLARGDDLRMEYAVRTALGAGRGRIVARVVLESLILGLAGGALGVLLAYGGTAGLVALDPPGVPRLGDVAVDGAVLAFALAVSVGTGLLFGVFPALRATAGDVTGSLTTESRGARGDRAGRRSRRLLVVGETAFAVVLLTGAALFIRSLTELMRVDPGIDVENVLTARVATGADRYPGDEEVRTFYGEVEGRLAALSGVEAAGAVTNLPFQGLGDMGVELEDDPIPPGGDKPAADWQVVTPGYFQTMGTTLLRGRTFDERDGPDAPGAAVVNRTMAERFWPDGSPLGERFLLGGGAAPGWVTVVGVVEDVTYDGPDARVNPQFYVPHRQFRFWNGGGAARDMALVLRTMGPPTALADDLRRVVADLDPAMAVSGVRTMAEIRGTALSRPRFLASLLSAFGALALVLASVGIYGVVSYGVRRRVGEIGIRMALGAGRSRVVRMVAKEGAILTGSGLVLGIGVALVGGRTVSGLLFGVSPGDPLTLAFVSGILAAVALLATLLPARRATRVDPVEALRSE